MKFFIPEAASEERALKIYSAIKENIIQQCGAKFSDRKIFKLHYKHDGKKYFSEIGSQEEPDGELVVAILFDDMRNVYHVCTPNRGVARGSSILVGEHEVLSVTDFVE